MVKCEIRVTKRAKENPGDRRLFVCVDSTSLCSRRAGEGSDGGEPKYHVPEDPALQEQTCKQSARALTDRLNNT